MLKGILAKITGALAILVGILFVRGKMKDAKIEDLKEEVAVKDIDSNIRDGMDDAWSKLEEKEKTDAKIDADNSDWFNNT